LTTLPGASAAEQAVNKTLKGQETMKNQSQTATLSKQMVLPFRSANEIHEWCNRHRLPLGQPVPLHQVAHINMSIKLSIANESL
jgi:hypothetical protein